MSGGGAMLVCLRGVFSEGGDGLVLNFKLNSILAESKLEDGRNFKLQGAIHQIWPPVARQGV